MKCCIFYRFFRIFFSKRELEIIVLTPILLTFFNGRLLFFFMTDCEKSGAPLLLNKNDITRLFFRSPPQKKINKSQSCTPCFMTKQTS